MLYLPFYQFYSPQVVALFQRITLRPQLQRNGLFFLTARLRKLGADIARKSSLQNTGKWKTGCSLPCLGSEEMT